VEGVLRDSLKQKASGRGRVWIASVTNGFFFSYRPSGSKDVGMEAVPIVM
jgi:hypothetical protein